MAGGQLSEAKKSILFKAIDCRRVPASDILAEIRKLDLKTDERSMFAERLLQKRRYFAAASIYAEIGMNEKAVEIADNAYQEKNSGNLYGDGFCGEKRRAQMLLDVASIYHMFGANNKKTVAAAVAEECEQRAGSFVAPSAYKELYMATSAKIYGTLGMNEDEARMYEMAAQEARGSERERNYLDNAITAHRKCSNYKRVADLQITKGNLQAALQTLINQVEPIENA